MSYVICLAVNVSSSVEARCLAVQWNLAHRTSQTSNVPRPMKAAHFEQVTFLDWLATAAAASHASVISFFIFIIIIIVIDIVIVLVIFVADSTSADEDVGHSVVIVTALHVPKNTFTSGQTRTYIITRFVQHRVIMNGWRIRALVSKCISCVNKNNFSGKLCSFPIRYHLRHVGPRGRTKSVKLACTLQLAHFLAVMCCKLQVGCYFLCRWYSVANCRCKCYAALI